MASSCVLSVETSLFPLHLLDRGGRQQQPAANGRGSLSKAAEDDEGERRERCGSGYGAKGRDNEERNKKKTSTTPVTNSGIRKGLWKERIFSSCGQIRQPGPRACLSGLARGCDAPHPSTSSSRSPLASVTVSGWVARVARVGARVASWGASFRPGHLFRLCTAPGSGPAAPIALSRHRQCQDVYQHRSPCHAAMPRQLTDPRLLEPHRH